MICNRCHIETNDHYKGQRCCKTCTKAKLAMSIAKDIEKRRKNAREWAHRNKETVAKYKKEYTTLNKERINERERIRKKRPHNRLKIYAKNRKRREQFLANPTKFSELDARLVHTRFDNQCFKCKATKDLHIDHHYPLSKGFALTHGNAVILCKSCNCSKNNKMPSEFYSPEELKKLEAILANYEGVH